MSELDTLARPYADAVFDLAKAPATLGAWSDALATLAAIVANEDFQALMSNPEIDATRLARAIIEIGGSDFGPEARNLVHLLAENDRLALAPAIAKLYEAARAESERRVAVSVVSAVALSDAQARALAQSLEVRLARRVELSFKQDETLIGGAIIRAGDLVIDGSLRAQLERMRQSLTR
jgi:F-type H+-transporting ATPase subunit delta